MEVSSHANSNQQARGRSLERFEASLKRLDPPAWMRHRLNSDSTTTTTDNSQATLTNHDISSRLSSARPRYSDHKRSYSAQRYGTASASNSYWRTEAARTPSSRGPSPLPGRPATAGGRFQTSSFSKYSSSTLCSDGGGNMSNGINTPTDSVTSAFSTSLHGGGAHTEPLYNPPPYPAPIYNPKATSHTRRPYLGWRSQDSLHSEDPHQRSSRMTSKYLTPAERLAYSYRHGGRSTSASAGNRYNNVVALHQRHPGLSKGYASDQFVHDSIKSVSSAIMEFCRAPDVPDNIRTPSRSRMRSGGSSSGGRDSARSGTVKEHRAQIVWLESSFVSNNPETKSKL